MGALKSLSPFLSLSLLEKKELCKAETYTSIHKTMSLILGGGGPCLLRRHEMVVQGWEQNQC